jgi:hypothetical protein
MVRHDSQLKMLFEKAVERFNRFSLFCGDQSSLSGALRIAP